MPRMVVIAGFLPFESGKTRLAARLVRALRERGVDVLPYKPIGAHNLWEQHFSIEYSIEKSVLVGGDAIRLAKAAGVKPDEIQPVDILLAPPDIKRYLSRPRDYLRVAAETFAQATLVRIDVCSGGKRARYHMLIRDTFENLPPSLKGVVDELRERLEPSPMEIGREEFMDMVASGQLTAAADICLSTHGGEHGVLLVESFNDVLLPTPKAVEAEYFLVAAPGRAVLYRGSDIERALRVLAGIRPGFTRTHEVLGLVKPLEVFDIDFAYSDDQVGEDVEKIGDTLIEKLGLG